MHLDATTTARLSTLVRLTQALVLCFAAGLWTVAWVIQEPQIGYCAAIPSVFWVVLRRADWHVRNQRRTVATYLVGGGALVAAPLLTLVLPQLAASNAVVPLLVATLLLQFAPYQHSKYYLAACGLTSVVTIGIGSILPASTLLAPFLWLLNTSLLLANVAVALVLLWQFSSRLRDMLAQVQENNTILATLNNRLQREIHERSRTEAALQASERRTRALLNGIPDSLYRMHADGRIIDSKPADGELQTMGDLLLLQAAIATILPDTTQIIQALTTRQVQRYESQQVIDGQIYAYEGRIVYAGDDEVVVIVRDVTELKAIDRLKSEFVSTVSHELRTPITGIYGSLRLLLGGTIGPIDPATYTLLDIAARNCDRLLRLVNDILDSEYLETGSLHVQLKPLELSALVTQVVEMNRAYGTPFNVMIEPLVPFPTCMVLADPDRLMQAITNILSNAIKFSPPQYSVTIGIALVASLVRISITDCGPGIPDSFRSRIFQRFAQADGSDRRIVQGSGLGLSIAKAIVERCNGHISFESEVGSGTTFAITLPLLSVEPAEQSSLAGCYPLTY